MEVTINLPDKIFANISSIASKSKRRVDEIIAEKIENEFSVNIEELEKQIAFCSDKELLELTKLQMPTKQDNHLSNLLHKQNEEDLTKSEQKELWKLMELNRLTTLKKAFALREASRRGLNGKD
ncbi:MAG: hypothetical protein K1X72_06560 [Pyrinomonadaceae bacterium]|nr:hypothetical protein [Pyrinomonadaceae bacterium]